ncbi:hypothetical protein, partial [Klebsiella pneumoniae]|uniref:hypothetical protein n=1 Tax=Klebsiella pneumoniae TaxID=573 RepID=UPI001C6F5DDE
MANNIIKGRKGGGSKQRTPTEQPDDLQSVAKAKILLALGEGALLQRLAAVRGRLSLCADQAAAAKWWLSMP